MSRSHISTTRAPAPVWVIQSYRAGENTQLLGLAERLGRPYRVIALKYRSRAGLLGLLRRCSLGGIDATSRAGLEPPWPDVLITAGLRNEPVCAWIRRASGGRTRLVFIGRTWQRPERFDLVVTTPQYRVRAGATVLENLLTQHRVTPERLQEAATRHRAAFEELPRPLIAVLLGGSSGPYVLGARSAERLSRDLEALVAATGGSLAVTSSSRTPFDFLETLLARLGRSAWVYRWRPDDPGNPYYGILALADALVVTGDSVAMLSEAAATGKPVLVFDIPTDGGGDSTPAAHFYRWMMRWLPDRLTRDVGLFHRRFVAAGLGRMLADPQGSAEWLHAARRAAESVGDATRERVEGLLPAPAADLPAAASAGPLPDQAASSGGARPILPRSTR